jgi:hypothetical protein
LSSSGLEHQAEENLKWGKFNTFTFIKFINKYCQNLIFRLSTKLNVMRENLNPGKLNGVPL